MRTNITPPAKQTRCISNRAFSQGKSKNLPQLVEYSNISDFMYEYYKSDPMPFEIRNAGTSFAPEYDQPKGITISTRKSLCKKCAFSKNSSVPDCCGLCGDTEKKFQAGWKVSVVQVKKEPERGHGPRCTETGTPNITLSDVRLKGRPAKLEVTRTGWIRNGKRISLDFIPGVQAEKNGRITLRLAQAINDAIIFWGPKWKYVAEGYGLSVSTVQRHIAKSTEAVKAKHQCLRVEDTIAKLQTGNVDTMFFSTTAVIQGESVASVFSTSSSHQLHLVDMHRTAAIPSTDDLGCYIKNTCFPNTQNFVTKLTQRAQFEFDSTSQNQTSFSPNLRYLLFLLWRELTVQLSAAHSTTPHAVLRANQAFLDSLLSPIFQPLLFWPEALHYKEILQICDLLYNLDFYPNANRVHQYLLLIEQLTHTLLREEDGKDLPFPVPVLHRAPTPEELQQANEAIDIFRHEAEKCSSGMPLQQIIDIVLHFNEAALPKTYTPEQEYSYTSIGTFDTTKITEYGIPLHCLTHLLHGGLLSEDPSRIPSCTSRQHFLAPDALKQRRDYPCPHR